MTDAGTATMTDSEIERIQAGLEIVTETGRWYHPESGDEYRLPDRDSYTIPDRETCVRLCAALTAARAELRSTKQFLDVVMLERDHAQQVEVPHYEAELAAACAEVERLTLDLKIARDLLDEHVGSTHEAGCMCETCQFLWETKHTPPDTAAAGDRDEGEAE